MDRSLVVAPLRSHKIENYITQHNQNTKQRETIFSTPTVVDKISTYKSLDSKKHYSRLYQSDNMQMALDHNYANIGKVRATKLQRGYTPQKNQSSVGNPITFQGDKTKEDQNLHALKKGKYSVDIYTVHGNFKPADRSILFYFCSANKNRYWQKQCGERLGQQFE
jgi:hypothetical protein